MICEVCEKEIGSRGYAVIAKPEPIHGCKECMDIVEKLILHEVPPSDSISLTKW